MAAPRKRVGGWQRGDCTRHGKTRIGLVLFSAGVTGGTVPRTTCPKTIPCQPCRIMFRCQAPPFRSSAGPLLGFAVLYYQSCVRACLSAGFEYNSGWTTRRLLSQIPTVSTSIRKWHNRRSGFINYEAIGGKLLQSSRRCSQDPRA
jgi:hypothetical protein